eukprot:3048903-Pyramimonas_sp.AAC.1
MLTPPVGSSGLGDALKAQRCQREARAEAAKEGLRSKGWSGAALFAAITFALSTVEWRRSEACNEH